MPTPARVTKPSILSYLITDFANFRIIVVRLLSSYLVSRRQSLHHAGFSTTLKSHPGKKVIIPKKKVAKLLQRSGTFTALTVRMNAISKCRDCLVAEADIAEVDMKEKN